MARKATRRKVRPRAPEPKSRAIGQRAGRMSDRSLVEAVKAWESLDLEAQRTLAFETAFSRATELQLAYPSVVSVASGFRTRGRWGKSGDRRKVFREPCVVLMVKRKWSTRPSSAAARKKELPKFLHAFCDAKEGDATVRRPCIVPVDVVEAGDHVGTLRNGEAARSRVHDDATPPARHDATGSLAAIVRASQSDERFALTCHHFGAMSRDYDGAPVARASIYLNGRKAEGRYAALSRHIGRIVEPPDASLDGALLRPEPDKIDAVRRAVGPYRPTTFWSPLKNPPIVVRVVVTDGRAPIRAEYVIRHPNFQGMKYFAGARPQPRHVEMWEYNVVGGTPTRGGDSGCAVLTAKYDCFVGMHLGGVNGTGRIFVLPAYLCLDAGAYGLTGSLSLES